MKKFRIVPIRYNLRSLAVRKTTSFAAAIGIALVVFVFSSSFMLSTGIKKTFLSSGRPNGAVIMRKGSDAELTSVIEASNVNVILNAPGVKRDERGRPLGAGELAVIIALEKIGEFGATNVQIRGVTEDAVTLRPETHIIAGRAPRPGTDEVLIGRGIRGRFKGVELGQSFELESNRPVTVVGVFEAGGSSYESEVWVGLETVRQAFRREGAVSSVRVLLESPAAFDGFKTVIESDKRLGVEALRESEYYDKQSEGTRVFVSAMGGFISVFFSVGAMIGAMITMYAAVANRQREIGTLRALGFSRVSVLTSFLIESLILALAGGAVGAAASIAMGLVKFSMTNFASWAEVVLTFEPTPAIIVRSLIFALVMGFLGGLFPAVRAARVSTIAAMRG